MFTENGKFVFRIYGADVNTTSDPVYGVREYTLRGDYGVTTDGIGAKYADIEVYDPSFDRILEGEQTEYINKYKTSSAGYRIVGALKMRPMVYPRDGVETFDTYFRNTAHTSSSLNDILTYKYHWLRFPIDWKIIPNTDINWLNEYVDVINYGYNTLPIAISGLSSERTKMSLFTTIEFEQRKVNGVI